MSSQHAIRVTCPTCQSLHEIVLPAGTYENNTHASGKGIITVSTHLPCKHACFVYIDANYKMRGGECADLSIDGGVEVKAASSATSDDVELLVMLTVNIVSSNIKETDFITALGARAKIDAMELALLVGELQAASALAKQMDEFASEIGEVEFAGRMRVTRDTIDTFLREKSDVVFTLPVGIDSSRKLVFLGVRTRAVIAGLEYKCIEGTLDKRAAGEASSRLLDLAGLVPRP